MPTPVDFSRVQSVPFVSAVANNQQIIAAQTGKRIRVLGFTVQSSAALAGAFLFKRNSGGATIWVVQNVLSNVNPPFILPFNELGYCETGTSEGLFTDVVTTALNFNVFYVVYTP